MQRSVRVATPPPKPLLVFDGDCNFCTLWVRRWEQITGDRVDYLPARDPAIATRFPEIPAQQFETAVQLIEPDGTIYSGAEAVFRTLANNPGWQWQLRWYKQSRLFAAFTEWVYRLVAAHRTLFSRLTRWFWGRHLGPSEFFLTRWLFLRLLGVIYLIAFVSLGTQISGLIGHNGILPAVGFMATVGQQCDRQGIALDRYYLLPTLCWFNASDGFLHFQCAAGSALAALLILGIAPVPCLALLWLLYLSLATVSRDFLGFQWDNLLLETGFLAIFLTPRQWLPQWFRQLLPGARTAMSAKSEIATGADKVARAPVCESPPSRIVLWLLRLLLFKLVFSSGCVKLASGDPNWRNLTALTFHYQTQPLPTWPGWYAQLLPLSFQKFSCAAMFGIELGAPFLIFAPRRLRFAGGAAIAFVQILILLTGNYTFFNWLTLALCLLLLDDFALKKLWPLKFRHLFSLNPQLSTLNPRSPRWPRVVLVPLAAIILSVDLLQISLAMGRQPIWLFPAAAADSLLSPLRTVNGYGLFAVMTTDRREIVVEGSNDGTNWLAYEFKYKPGDINRRPGFVAPFQPRLDWQMWFAALGDYRQNPWFVEFGERLLQGSPEVLALLAKNPFPGRPPRYVRAEFYDYRFTTAAERRAMGLRPSAQAGASSPQAGAWWQREFIGEYLPPLSLQE
jgi:lipase maturation factor 1